MVNLTSIDEVIKPTLKEIHRHHMTFRVLKLFYLVQKNGIKRNKQRIFCQECWREIHERNVGGGREAVRCDKTVSLLQAEYERQYRQVASLSLSCLTSCLPVINTQVQQVMLTLGKLENLVVEVEVALLALEDTIDAREAQEKQLEQRFQIAIYQERRKQELEELEARLETQYQRRMKERMLAEEAWKKERQAVFQAKFEEDLSTFSSTGRLQVPLIRPSDVSLESIDLDADDHHLESFLKEDCPDLSPLPRDDVPIMKDPVQSPEINIEEASGGSSRGSIYTTPDTTLETIKLN